MMMAPPMPNALLYGKQNVTNHTNSLPPPHRRGLMTHEEIHIMLRKKKEQEEENKAKQIQFIEFESYKELIPFLESLFKLKPSLITSFS